MHLGDYRHAAHPHRRRRRGPLRAGWWAFDDGRALYRDVRRFGRIAVVPIDDRSALPALDRLGPEPFDPGFDGDAPGEGAAGQPAPVKTQLLSQRPVAGVGNIYADEALWLAGSIPGGAGHQGPGPPPARRATSR